ncbi:site-specific integrase [Gordonia sp. i37]|uniref:tyrosine-type recombinase/integrase n=1 Tax=Gordonia sp. i37 TaxID=1961707 RepID=UPI0009CA9490|nr:site-specific integrase [Gordonia sp. i37]OPX16000.1 hypothetical protein B1964_07025 [Gordonia sp. i37]
MSISTITLDSGRKSYQVEWRTPDRRKHRRRFGTRREAIAFEAEIRAAKNRGLVVDARAGKTITVEQCYRQWRQSRQEIKAKTAACWSSGWKHVDARFAGWPVGSVDTPSVQEWLNDLRVGPRMQRQSLSVLRQTMAYAVERGWIMANPALGVTVPPLPRRESHVLTTPEVMRLREMCRPKPSDDRVPVDQSYLVPVLAFTGLRVGEAAGLNVGDIDLKARRIHVRGTKTRAARRTVGIPEVLVDELRQQIGDRSANSPAFLSPLRYRLRPNAWVKAVRWAEATSNIGHKGLRVHDLRHTYASILRRAGADLKLLQASMGHESIQTTAHIYAHLYTDELVALTSAIDKQITATQPT